MAEMEIASNVARVCERIAKAAERAGRAGDEITLVAVSKTVDGERIAQGYDAGLRHFGENYVQEALSKIGRRPLDRSDICWHFIGHLQRNKVRDVVGRFTMLHSVDSLALAHEIARWALRAGQAMPILLEVKLDAVEARSGFMPDAVIEAAQQIAEIEGIALRGLMGIAPFGEDSEQARPHFRRMHEIYSRLPAANRHSLSMGMTGDFEVAIEEGATHVRIGTALFGRRGP